MVVASFHLARFGAASAARQMAGVPVDRRALSLVPGARFTRLLGTGRGTQMAASVDLRRWAVFAVWDGGEDLARFRRTHPLWRRWERATERFDVVLEPIGAHGAWDGADPLGQLLGPPRDEGADAAARSAPVAVVTRAKVRWAQVPAFLRAVPAVDRALASADGLLATVGIGEWPVGRQATFSLWRDATAMRTFAYRGAEHTEVIRRTRDERWYSEEWFARFRPVEWSGTWNGADPLA